MSFGKRSSVEILYAVKEFYVLQAIEANMKVDQFKHSHQRWKREFEEYKETFINKFENAIFDYTVIVCAGEARHARGQAAYWCPSFELLKTSRYQIYDEARFYNPNSVLKVCYEIFKGPWCKGFGGEKWAAIAELGLKRKIWNNKIVFIDRAVDLSHNNSPYFDKGASNIFWLNNRLEYLCYLDLKRYAQPIHIIQASIVSNKLYILGNRAKTLNILPKEITFVTNDDSTWNINNLLDYQPIKWDNKEIPFVFEKTGVYIATESERLNRLKNFTGGCICRKCKKKYKLHKLEKEAMQPYFNYQIKLEVIRNATQPPKTSAPTPKTKETYVKEKRGEEDYYTPFFWGIKDDIDNQNDDIF